MINIANQIWSQLDEHEDDGSPLPFPGSNLRPEVVERLRTAYYDDPQATHWGIPLL